MIMGNAFIVKSYSVNSDLKGEAPPWSAVARHRFVTETVSRLAICKAVPGHRTPRLYAACFFDMPMIDPTTPNNTPTTMLPTASVVRPLPADKSAINSLIVS